MRLKGTICKFKGHEWGQRPVSDMFDVAATVGVCGRCGSIATIAEAMAADDRVPAELLDQDDIDKLRAMYRDGEITEEELELGIGATLGDEEDAEKLKEMVKE